MNSHGNEAIHVGVIGAGIAGLTASRLLVEAGFRVSIFAASEDKKRVIRGGLDREGAASQAAVGMVTLKGLEQARTRLFEKKIVGAHSLLRAVKEAGVASFLGVLETFQSQEEEATLRGRIYRDRSLPQAVERVGSEVLAGRGLEGYGAFFYREDGWIHSRQWLAYLREELRGQGVGFFAQKIDKIIATQMGWCLHGHGEDLNLQFSALLLATGAGTKSLLLRSGLAPVDLLETPGWSLFGASSRQEPLLLTTGKMNLAWTPEGLGFGSLDSKGLGGERQEPDLEDWRDLLGPWKGKVEGELLEGAQQRGGIRVGTRHRHPLAGAYEGARNLFLLTGFHRSGLSLAAGAAKEVVELMEAQLKDK